MAMSSNLVEARSINGTTYLLVPKKQAEKIDLREGQGFFVSVDDFGVHYQKIVIPEEAKQA